MLDGLGTIAWNTRTHAFGEATNVPSLLRAVADGDDAAISELFNTIWHQGTVYDATAAAVPFLGELASSEHLKLIQRKLVFALLFAIGRGKGYWQVHAATLGRLGGAPHDLPALLAAEQLVVADCRSAVALEAAKVLDRIDQVPGALWLSVAALVLVAGPSSPASGLRRTRPELAPFGEAAVDAILELRSSGRLPSGRVQHLAALDAELNDFLRYGPEEAIEDVVLEDSFVDVLVERMCDSDGTGSAPH